MPKTTYICAECGAKTTRWQGQCPRCGTWNKMIEQVERASRASASKEVLNRPSLLAEMTDKPLAVFTSSIPELDELLGNGVVPGAAILLGGEPGVGKSTILLQVAAGVAKQSLRVVYVSGEESLEQIRGRAARLGVLECGLEAMACNQAEDILALMDEKECPHLLIIDSVQTMACSHVDGTVGSVSQVRAVSTMLMEKAKQTGCTIILVGHVTKEGQIAGPKLLEHMVDTVLYLEGERRHLYRVLRVVKNRFGPNNELLLFEIKGEGMDVVHDPSTFFLQDRDAGLSGTALVMAVESRRPFVVEVQALVSKSFLNFPRRTALGFDANRLNLLLAVVEKRLRLPLSKMDIYTKVGGGLKIQDPGLDLGLIAAVLSSFFDRPLPDSAVFWGEVDLNGQIRPVSGQDIRSRQALSLGYAPIFAPQGEGTGRKVWKNLLELHQELFAQAR
ncbi:MAG: DNA repair protein RadA [Deltaproteobacteria bacterium]|nr:MAG: DNA repair protein RadA [Deltaproteobacteria bacterium]